MVKNKLRPIHPGKILEEEFLKPSKHTGLTATSLANAIGVPPNRITAIIQGQRGITGNTAVRLSEFFGNTAKFWMNLQASYDLRKAEKSMKDMGSGMRIDLLRIDIGSRLLCCWLLSLWFYPTCPRWVCLS